MITRSDLGDHEDRNTHEAQCFRAGCLLPVRYASTEEYEAAAEAFRTIHDPDAPHGARIMLPPRTGADGMVETGWIMLPPKPEGS